MEKTKKRNQWSQQEINLLNQAYSSFTSKKWKRISHLFHEHGFNRSQLQCREKWINFVDPTINNKEWEPWELKKLYQIHEQYGTRWCLVQKQIGRTQNKIKNRFYGTIRNFIRYIVNTFDRNGVCYNFQISKLSPKFLNEMFKGQNEFSFLNQEVKTVIAAMGYKIQKKLLTNRIRQQKRLYEKLNKIIFAAFESKEEEKTLNRHSTSEERLLSQPLQQQDQIKKQQKNQLFLHLSQGSFITQKTNLKNSIPIESNQVNYQSPFANQVCYYSFPIPIYFYMPS